MTKKQQLFIKYLIKKTKHGIFGYEETLSYCHGMIDGWLEFHLISKEFAKELLDHFANECYDEEEDRIDKKYGRLIDHSSGRVF